MPTTSPQATSPIRIEELMCVLGTTCNTRFGLGNDVFWYIYIFICFVIVPYTQCLKSTVDIYVIFIHSFTQPAVWSIIPCGMALVWQWNALGPSSSLTTHSRFVYISVNRLDAIRAQLVDRLERQKSVVVRLIASNVLWTVPAKRFNL